MSRYCIIEDCSTRASCGRFCAAHDPDRYLRQSLPAGPLIEAVEARGGITGCGVPAHTALSRSYYRVRDRGVLGPMRADRLAHELLGCHPCEIWGDWFGPYGVSV